MVLKDFMAISGQPGLFKFIAQGKNAIIVEHLETGKRSSAFNSAKVSSLEEISIFTKDEDMPLAKVFDLIWEKGNGGAAIDYRSDPETLKKWFEGVLPEYNREKVYVSDIKKVAHWYDILHRLNMLVKEEPEKPAEATKSEEPAETVEKEKSGVKKTVRKKPKAVKEPAEDKKPAASAKCTATPRKKPSKPAGK
jgi:hypothetical protein